MANRTGLGAAAAIRAHHEELHDGLRTRVLAVIAAAGGGGDQGRAREEVLEFLDRELLPHAAAEERTLYVAGDAGPSALLVEAMRTEHRDIVGRVDGLRRTTAPLEAATVASAILALFESHLSKENDRLIPALLARPDVSLGDLLAGMHELVG